MPTRGHGYGDFANEKYYPPVLSELEEHSSQNIQDYPYDPYLVIEEQPERHPTLNFENNNNNNEQLIFEPDELNQINKYDDEELYEISRKLDELERQRKVNAAKETTIFRSRRQPHDEIPRSLGAEVDDYLEYLKDSTDKYEDADEENDGEDKNDSWFDTSSLRKSNNERVDKSTLKDLARMEFLKNDRAWDGLRDEESTDDKEEDDEKESEEIEEILNKDNAKLLKNNETPEENSGIYFEGGFIKPLNYRNIYEKGYF